MVSNAEISASSLSITNILQDALYKTMLLRPPVAPAWKSTFLRPASIQCRTSCFHTLRQNNPNPRLNNARQFPSKTATATATPSYPYLHHGVRSIPWGTRRLSTALPAVLVPPVVFVGLALTLWFYKCCMMVIFQNKIIYMPSIPPFSRAEKIEDYEKACRPVIWEEKRIRSLDGTQIALCVGSVEGASHLQTGIDAQGTSGKRKHVVVLYFQGNASSLPPRLPLLSAPLKILSKTNPLQTDYTIVALSYRGYWTSRGRASQNGLELDALAALRWVENTYVQDPAHTRLILWGQSIGAGVATGLLKQNLSSETPPVKVNGVILETPFVNTRSMLAALYPQKWLPYRYLWPFLRSWWDSEGALRAVAQSKPGKDLPILIISAAKDEIVPEEQADYLEKLTRGLGFDVRRKDVSGSLHTEATIRAEGREAVVTFLRSAGEG
ncbi:hypothetical protein FQN51_002784 [Onygenales sp. PD_10]|nr:hypothetical protein FQN51_002784 [Onygenales sp. PD_10]